MDKKEITSIIRAFPPISQTFEENRAPAILRDTRRYVPRKRKERFYRKKLVGWLPRRTEISCVSLAQLPFENGIIKV